MPALTFTAHGNLLGHAVTLHVRDGHPEGDAAAVALVQAMIAHGAPVSIPGIWTGPAALDPEPAAMATVRALFDEDGALRVEGLVVPERYGWAPDDSVQ